MTQLSSDICNVILFGASGAGKSSIVNMLASGPVAEVSSGIQACTFKSREYNVNVLGKAVTLWDTPGLDEGEEGRLPPADAITQLYQLLLRLTGGVSLLVLVTRAPRIKDSTPANWRLFRDIICQGKVPTALIITGLEEEEDMDQWWWDYKGDFEEYDIFPADVACVTASRGKARRGGHVYDGEYDESRKKIRKLIRSTTLVDPFRVEPLVWFEKVVDTWVETEWCGRVKKEMSQERTEERNPLSELLRVPGITSKFIDELTIKLKATTQSICEQIDGTHTGVYSYDWECGAWKSVLDERPLKKISASELERLCRSEGWFVFSEATCSHLTPSFADYDNTKVYLVHAKPEDYFVRKNGRTFDRQGYYANLGEWECVFGERIMPYVTLLINGTGWSTGFPHLLSTKQLASATTKAQSLNLPGAVTRGKCIGDISCDIGGGLEFLERSTTLSEPTYKFAVSDTSGQTTMMSVDILPTALPLDASNHFSKEFYPYLRTLIQNVKTYDLGSSNEWKGGIDTNYTEALERATIASRGQLRKKHQWLQPPVDKWHEEQRGVGRVDNSAPVQLGGTGASDTVDVGSRKKKVLIFGSGMVAGPAVQEIAKRRDTDFSTNMPGEAQQLAIRHGQEHNNIKYRIVDIARRETYEHFIKDADVVISLLPAAFHVEVAEMCIANRKHLVTASYISEGMRDLHDRTGERNRFFYFVCGGLPAPDSIYDATTGNGNGDPVVTVPLKYKFSWSPVGVLRAANQGVRYLLNGRIVKLPGEDLLRSAFPRLPIPLMQGVDLEGIPNRDSLPYRETYGLQNEGSLRTLVRGTLRYPGFCSLMQSFKDLGLLEDTSKISISSWDTLLPTALAHKVKSSCGFDVDMDNRSLESIMRDVVPWDRNVFGETLSALEWLGLWSSANGVGAGGAGKMNGVHVPMIPHTPLELFAMVLAHRLRYAATERDMVVLSHEVITRPRSSPSLPASSSQLREAYEIHKSTLVTYATDSSNSAMARTVGLPIAFAALDVLDGKVKMRGVGGPGDESGVCESVLGRLEGVGLEMVESVEIVKGGGVGSGGVEERLVGCLM
ncbi:Alpha-aminoadipic semialdehyde synthase, mitochondrial [Leucoagaricus sp. SymC.cos]|nr:Alpha-aminoadipic semialdehyde synthase, mitochondrial [Leucoagaricus sp. SymC.cos]